ncbi:hypothetical protein [Virgisporangium aliadipatigenens]|nr:hypothetical protein [Virgisporangium aliadipatigenens]
MGGAVERPARSPAPSASGAARDPAAGGRTGKVGMGGAVERPACSRPAVDPPGRGRIGKVGKGAAAVSASRAAVERTGRGGAGKDPADWGTAGRDTAGPEGFTNR